MGSTPTIPGCRHSMASTSTARQRLDLAYAYSPENAEINFAEGNLHLALGRTDEAAQYYLAALRLDPTHAGAGNNLGVLALKGNIGVRRSNAFVEQSPARRTRPSCTTFWPVGTWFRQSLRGTKETTAALKLEPARGEFVALLSEIERTRAAR